MAVLVNASVYNSCCARTLVPWTVHCTEDERLTLSGFFEMVVSTCRSDETTQGHLNDHKLEEVRVGKAKDALDAVSDTGTVGSRLSAQLCATKISTLFGLVN